MKKSVIIGAFFLSGMSVLAQTSDEKMLKDIYNLIIKNQMLSHSIKRAAFKHLTPAQALLATPSRSNAQGQSMVNVGKLDALGEPRFLENVKMFLGRASKQTKIPEDIFKYM